MTPKPPERPGGAVALLDLLVSKARASLAKRLAEVVDEVVGVFEADRQSQ
jgi:hypothetical protein